MVSLPSLSSLAPPAWSPWITGPLATRAWSAVRAIADELGALLARPSEALVAGTLGADLALFFRYLHAASGDARHAALADQAMELAGEALASAALTDGLFDGFCRIGWTVEHLRRRGWLDADADTCAVLDDALRAPRPGHFDLMSGLCGHAVYALERQSAALQGLLAARLAAAASAQPAGRAWHSDPRHLAPWQAAAHPDGYFDLGLSHGTPGPLRVLAELTARGVPTAAPGSQPRAGARSLAAAKPVAGGQAAAKSVPAAERVSDTTPAATPVVGAAHVGHASSVAPSITAAAGPGRADAQAAARNAGEPAQALDLLEGAVRWQLAAEEAELAPSGFRYFTGGARTAEPARLAWCYGDPGVAVALVDSGRLLGRPDWIAEGTRIASRAAQVANEHAGVHDAGICHGAAGLAHTFRRLALATGDALCEAAAERWVAAALAMRRPDGASFLALDHTRGGWIRDASLLTGTAGIGLVLLAALTPVEPGWDRLLLLSSEVLP